MHTVPEIFLCVYTRFHIEADYSHTVERITALVLRAKNGIYLKVTS